MIVNLLDVSKADEGQLAPDRSDVDLRGLVAEVIAELEVNAQRRNVCLLSTVETDRTKPVPVDAVVTALQTLLASPQVSRT